MNLIEKVVAFKDGKPSWSLGATRFEHKSLISSLRMRNNFGVAIVGEIRGAGFTYANKARWSAEEIIAEYSKRLQAISVFTEKNFFKGDIGWIALAKKTGLPVAVLDFFTLPEELGIIRSYGADAAVLIADILDDRQLRSLAVYGKSIGLEIVIEVQDEVGVERAKNFGADIIGINTRDLHDLKKIDQEKPERLRKLIAPELPVIVESGIRFPHDLYRYANIAAGLMIGTTFVESENLEHCLASFCDPAPESFYPFIWTKPAAYFQQTAEQPIIEIEKRLQAQGFRIRERAVLKNAPEIACALYKQKLSAMPREGLRWYWLIAAYYDLLGRVADDRYSEIIFFERRENLIDDLVALNGIKKEFRETENKDRIEYDFCGKKAEVCLHTFHVANANWQDYREDLRIIMSTNYLSESIVDYVASRKYRQETWFNKDDEEVIPWLR